MLSEIKRFVRRNLAPQPAQWPFVRGNYTVVDAGAPVVVATSGPSRLAKALRSEPPAGLCMVAVIGSADETADLLRAIAANLSVQTLICIESEASKLPLGSVLFKLGRGDEAPAGAVGSLMNVVASQIDSGDLGALRRRIDFVDLLKCPDASSAAKAIEEARAAALPSNAGFVTSTTESGIPRLVVPRDARYELIADKTGHFKIRLEEQSIAVEHLNGKNRVLRVIEAKTARDMCLTLIRNGWVSKLDHAAYLGRELARAEHALRNGGSYTQDGTEPGGAAPPARRER